MYDEVCLDAFLEQQGKLFKETVAENREEAEAFLEDCMEELADAAEVFALPDGRYLIVEA